ncbi:MAG: thermonuclease family protein [Nitrososphaeraceae archaeon]
MTSKIIVLGFCMVLVSMVPTILHMPSVDARCPDGTHKSPSGDCEKVTHSGGLPRCPDGFHRSPDGDCERVSSGNDDSTGGSGSDDDEENDDENARRTDEGDNDDNDDEGSNSEEASNFNSQTPVSRSTECKGSADCFRGTVTEIVDGDTLDVNNVRIRLAMVNTPEVGESGYDAATDTTESECSIGSEALVDEDDGQKEGSYSRLIGIVYCNGNGSSLNEILMESGQAVLYEDFCGVSEFAKEGWVNRYGC